MNLIRHSNNISTTPMKCQQRCQTTSSHMAWHPSRHLSLEMLLEYRLSSIYMQLVLWYKFTNILSEHHQYYLRSYYNVYLKNRHVCFHVPHHLPCFPLTTSESVLVGDYHSPGGGSFTWPQTVACRDEHLSVPSSAQPAVSWTASTSVQSVMIDEILVYDDEWM